MIEKTINYVGFDGEEHTETHYFNISETEAIEWEFSKEGGMSNLLRKVAEEKDQKKIIEFMQELILRAYGERSEDGKSFLKSKKRSKAFKQTLAYNALFMELATDDVKAAEFANGILPRKLVEEAEKVNKPTPKASVKKAAPSKRTAAK